MGKVLTFLAVFAAGLLLMEPTPKVVAQAEPVQAEIRIGRTERIPPDELAQARREMAESLRKQGCEKEAAWMAELAEKSIVEKIASQAPAAKDYGCDTYRIRARGWNKNTGLADFPSGSCVSVGKGRFASAAHIVERLKPGYEVDVQIGEVWHPAHFWVSAFHDFAFAQTDQYDTPSVEMRQPKYGERVTLYGLTTCEPQGGIYYFGTIGMDENSKGVDFGDSGGGVFGEDGALVGIVTGFVGTDHRDVIPTAVPKVIPEMKPPARKAETPKAAAPIVAKPQPLPQPFCPGGVCPRPMQYQPQQRRGWFRGR